MADARSRPVIIAGAGIAGLTAALAFAGHGFRVRVFERAARLEETGAGIQLSPNATRLLRRLGALERLRPASVTPDAVVLREAASLRELARVPLGVGGETRWGAPYLTVHRADLQRALTQQAASEPLVEIHTGAEVTECMFDEGGAAALVAGATERIARGSLLVGADGVRSATRRSAGLGGSRFSGQVAWRAMIPGEAARDVIPRSAVSAFLHKEIHLVAYPIRGGAMVNLAAIMKGSAKQEDGGGGRLLLQALRSAAPRLKRLVEEAGPWSTWPLYVARPGRWTNARGLALIGDAAHAMTPFAAQGAAMAIEDAVVLADAVAAAPGNLPAALASYERLRRPRIARVERRGALNRLAWHAAGPVALARNLILKLRPPERLAADLDWLYGWDV